MSLVNLMGGRLRVRVVRGTEARFTLRIDVRQTVDEETTDTPVDIQGWTFRVFVKNEDGEFVEGTCEVVITDEETPRQYVLAVIPDTLTDMEPGTYGIRLTAEVVDVKPTLIHGVLDIRNADGTVCDA